MARGHAHDNCRYGDDGFAFAPRPELEYRLGHDDERDHTFVALGTALESLHGPVTASAKKLTAADIKTVLESGTVENRHRALRALGLNLTPRSVGTALSADVRGRLNRAPQPERRHAADRLAAPVYKSMLVASMAPNDVAATAAERVSTYSPALLRFALWAGTLPSAGCARVLVWAGEQPWFPTDDVPPEAAQAVLDAAQAVVDATPEFDLFTDLEPGGDVDDLIGDDGDANENSAVSRESTATEQNQAITASTPSAHPDTTDDSDTPTASETPAEPAGAHPAEAEFDPVDEAGDAVVVMTTEELTAALTALETTLADAAGHAREVLTSLEAGQPPAPEHLAVLESARREFETAEAHLRAAGVAPTERSTNGLRESLEAASQREGEATLRAGLDVFSALSAGDDSALAAALGQALTRADALASSMLWSAGDRAEAQALALIAELATGTVEPAQMLAAQERIVSAAPHLALLAIRAGALSAPTETASVPVPEQTAAGPAPAEPTEEPAIPSPTVEPEPEQEPEPEPEPARDEGHTDQAPVAASTKEDTRSPEPIPDADRAQTPAPASEVPQPAPAHQSTPPQPDEPHDPDAPDAQDSLRGSIDTLLTQGRYALVAEISARCSSSPLDPELLRSSALAAAVRTPHGQVASALHQRIADLDSDSVGVDTTALLLAAPALLRTALVTGEPAAGAVLLALQPHLGQRLGTLAGEVGRRAVTGVLVEAPPLTALADVAETEQALANAQETARELLRPRRMRFKRASDIVNGWLDPDGLIGAALHAVVDDERDKLDLVTTTIATLNDPTEVAKSIDTEDRKLRTTSSKALQGAVRNELLTEATKAIPPLSQWAESVAALALADRSARWSTSEAADMRTAVLNAGPAALDALAGRCQDVDPLVAAVATSAHHSLAQTLSLLEGTEQVNSAEPPPAAVLGLDLLHVTGAHVDVVTGVVTLPEQVAEQDFRDAIDRTWDDAVRMHVEQENFAAAHHLVRSGQAGLIDGASVQISEEVAALVTSHEQSARSELDWRRSELGAELRNARRNNQITEEQDAELTAMLRDTERPGSDLAAVRSILDQISKRLPDYRVRAAQTLHKRLEDINSKSATTKKVGPEDISRVTGFITSGDLGTAEELIYLLETNEQLPSPRRHEYLTQFFPTVPDALPDGITGSLIEICRDGGTVATCPTLTFASLSPDQAAQAADALAGWRTLGATPVERRHNVSETELLLPALRVAGLEAKKTVQLNDLPRARDRRYVDVGDVTINGKAMVPAFGSRAGDRRRVLLAWGRPSAESLMSWVDQDPSGEAVIVAYFGTMSAQVRRDMAALTPRSHAPVIVLDDAALAYLAARGERLLQATMGILLPFAHVNPYVHEKRGLVAREMFYGREKEQRQVIDPGGTQIIYGGRGLGKSALLRDAESAFERSSPAPGARIAVYLSLDDLQIGAGKAMGAEALWDGLLSALIRRDVIPSKGSGRRGTAHNKVIDGINDWLDADTSRRLLILLDESDRFFESDAPLFLETSRLRNLGTTTRDRAKVVFAGLHSVQRFAKVASNGPFSHLAQRPTVIGPLKPQSALNLLTEPMAAMGYEFEEPDLVNRVLANCSYQPFLLQMFGHRLVEHMHDRRRELGVQLPYRITRADIESVETNEALREDISAAFKDTLNLDPRYNVIANVMARNVHESGLESRLTDTELREECLQWWEEGFTDLDTAAFRSYLNEMVGLGVLAPNSDGRGWRLRGPAVLTMVGTPSDVENQLLGADTESLRDGFVALFTRMPLPGGRYAPLTAEQVNDVLGDHAIQVRVVCGSSATGIADVGTTIKMADANRFTVLSVTSRNAFESALTAGEPGKRRVVISDLTDFAPDVCATTLRSAIDLTPDRPGVTRSAVLVTDAHQMPFWREVMATQTPSLGLVTLSRHDAKTLRVWTLSAQQFSGPERLDRLFAVTGGWPFLLERASSKATTASREPAVLDALEEHLGTDDGARELVDAVGVLLDPMVATAYGDLVTLLGPDSTDLAGLVTAADSTTDPEGAVACLEALGAFDRLDKGKYRLEPVLARAWSLLPTTP